MPLYALKECGEETLDLKETLKYYFGYDSLRPGAAGVNGGNFTGKDVLGIMPTGAGKSLCYQVPALMLDGITTCDFTAYFIDVRPGQGIESGRESACGLY